MSWKRACKALAVVCGLLSSAQRYRSEDNGAFGIQGVVARRPCLGKAIDFKTSLRASCAWRWALTLQRSQRRLSVSFVQCHARILHERKCVTPQPITGLGLESVRATTDMCRGQFRNLWLEASIGELPLASYPLKILGGVRPRRSRERRCSLL